MFQTVQLFDPGRNLIAAARVEEKGVCLSGAAEVEPMPAALRRKFEEYEALVNGQVLSLLDPVEDEIAATPVFAIPGDGRRAWVEDLQIFPQAKTVSFRLAQSSARSTGLTA